MNEAFKIAIVLVFIFTFWFMPSSPFLVEWLTQSKGFTAEQVYQDLFPLWSYSQFLLIIAGLVAQYVSFRAVFVTGAALNLASNAFLLWGDTLWWMRGSEIANGAAVGIFSIFMAYLFTSFPEAYHQRITSYSRAATLIATTASASAGQLIVDHTGKVLLALCISVATGFASWLISFLLPTPVVTMAETDPIRPQLDQKDVQIQTPDFVVLPQETDSQGPSEGETEEGRRILRKSVGRDPLLPKDDNTPVPSYISAWRKFKGNYSPAVVVWSTWAGICFAIHMLVLTYWQSVMYEINPKVNWNGYVSTVAYALAAGVTLIPTKIEPFLNRVSDWLLGLLPVVYGTVLLLLSRETVIYLAYVWLIVYHSLFEFMFSVSSVQIARRTGKSKQFGIVFSLSMLVALVFQNLLQFIVGKQVLNLHPVNQYALFGYTFFGTSAICFVGKLVHVVYNKSGSRS